MPLGDTQTHAVRYFPVQDAVVCGTMEVARSCHRTQTSLRAGVVLRGFCSFLDASSMVARFTGYTTELSPRDPSVSCRVHDRPCHAFRRRQHYAGLGPRAAAGRPGEVPGREEGAADARLVSRSRAHWHPAAGVCLVFRVALASFFRL